MTNTMTIARNVNAETFKRFTEDVKTRAVKIDRCISMAGNEKCELAYMDEFYATCYKCDPNNNTITLIVNHD